MYIKHRVKSHLPSAGIIRSSLNNSSNITWIKIIKFVLEVYWVSSTNICIQTNNIPLKSTVRRRISFSASLPQFTVRCYLNSQQPGVGKTESYGEQIKGSKFASYWENPLINLWHNGRLMWLSFIVALLILYGKIQKWYNIIHHNRFLPHRFDMIVD
jgi:hypothetical protein